MSLDLYLYSKKSPNRKSVEQLIFPLGFEPVDEPSGRWYWWFKTENYESLRGCRLYISKADPKDREIPRGTRTIFHSCTNAGRSYEDLAMQNNVLRKLKSVFGGSVYDPQEGRYAYIENDIPCLSPAEKRCGFVYANFHNNLGRAMMGTADLDPKFAGLKQIHEEMASYDRGIITNNLVAVFLVSILESFLKDLFIAYIDMHPKLQEKIFSKTSKIDYQTLRELLEKKKSLAEVEADSYTFQNLLSANAAYSTYIELNLFNVWNRKKKIGKRFYNIREIIEELVQLRHKIVHTAYLELDFDRAKVDKYRIAVELAGKFLAEALEKRGFRIDLEKYG